MIYIFKVIGTEFVKLGFTHGDPWTRVATGFWSNLHPKACCGRLGWDNLELVGCFDGGAEIEAAIKRIKDGTYGICEVTQEPIAKDRLLAVPFTRYSASAQKELERNRHRSRTQAGILGEMGEDGAPSGTSGDDNGE
jgi:hypothetical protein